MAKKQPNKPQWEEFYAYCKSRNHEDKAITAWDYYEAGDWHDSNGKPVLNWKQKLIAVWFKNGKTTAKTTNTNSPKSHLQQLQERYFGGNEQEHRPDTLDIPYQEV